MSARLIELAGPLDRLLQRPAEWNQAGEPDWLEPLRRRAIAGSQRLGLPSRKLEAWRYTGLEPILSVDYRPAEGQPRPSASDLDRFDIEGLDAWRLALINGVPQPQLSRLDGIPAGVRIENLRQALARDPDGLRPHLARLERERDIFTLINTGSLAEGLFIRIPAGLVLDRPIELLHLGLGGAEPLMAHPRTLVVLEGRAEMALLERHLSLDDSRLFQNRVGQWVLGEGASLTHYQLREEGIMASAMTGHYLDLGEGSRYRGLVLTSGGGWSRTDTHVTFRGEGADAELDGLYLCGNGQLLDHHLDILHGPPRCRSRVQYRGILGGRARAVFDGRIRVARDAQGSDARLQNHNLLLSRHAEIDSKPQLEILADEVQCSHGATVGQIEEEKLFYLRSRGIPAPKAREMLCLAFAGEILERCRDRAIAAHLVQVAREALAAMEPGADVPL